MNDSFEAAQPLLSSSDALDVEAESSIERPESKRVLARLYISHFLSTWNSRMFEFGAVLFLAFIFQETLLYASLYALVRALSAAVLSSWLGSVVDRSNRLVALRQSIVWQRIPVAVSCACFVVQASVGKESTAITLALFAFQVLLACVEKLAATANTVAIERDWAVVISDSLNIPRQELNSSMRRIDLFCKLLAPVFISLLDGLSNKIAIWTVFGMNASCVLVEYMAIAQVSTCDPTSTAQFRLANSRFTQVYQSVPELARNQSILTDEDDEQDQTNESLPTQNTIRNADCTQKALAPWREYVSSPVFLASFALSLLYLTVLSFGATMVTYLLHTGFNPLQVSCMRIGSVIAELSGTWAAPFITNKIGPIRSGLWFLNWQFCTLATAAAAFSFFDSNSQLVAVSLIVGVALSRIGLWGFDLSVQFLVQESVEEHARARFSATEMALQNIFELLSFATTIVFPLPEQFKYPVLISYGAIAMAAICFAGYVRKERGHLLHMSKCIGGDKTWMHRDIQSRVMA
ncbi:hypothetical protein ASPWEDRAFT_107452 [Aspergillus wentii DTO 134E9]|uniref:Solute carrier family 40 member n=1 Tax=Aspergillus wentii DTO 134E9 TaxID=1073089 RepID=A0A1L9RQY3_ASPWE|nr:uncharacterized protein ASPWEDRAFT_107452 [Aspergillus wentii DTO 134E9]OJJ37341.1 hypothetical protein ASPWEDRAFT_107452 [Aspergillus wentii DTO 134E9]